MTRTPKASGARAAGGSAGRPPARRARGAAEPAAAPAAALPELDSAGATIIAAATDLVIDEGLNGFSMDELARRARVSKATIYKQWPARSDLLREVCRRAPQFAFASDTGSVRGDVEGILEPFRQALATGRQGALVAAITEAAERDESLAEFLRQTAVDGRAGLVAALNRGVERGELARGTDVGLLADLLSAPFFYRRFITRVGLTTRAVREVVDAVLEPRLQQDDR